MACNLYKMHLLFSPRSFLLNLFLPILHYTYYLNPEKVLLALLCSVESWHRSGIWCISNILQVIITSSYLLVAIKHNLPVLTSKTPSYLRHCCWCSQLEVSLWFSPLTFISLWPSSQDEPKLITLSLTHLFSYDAFINAEINSGRKLNGPQKTSLLKVPAVLNHYKYILC